MNLRISQLQNEEVDYLRFDRIKIQRKRMEHILEVIKDLTFKNKQLIRHSNQLKQELEEQRHFRHLYEELEAERQLLIDKNLALSKELAKYRETALHQEMLINTLKEELSAQEHRSHQFKSHYHTQPNFLGSNMIWREAAPNPCRDESWMSQDYQILKAQYRELQDEYSMLYKQQFKGIEKIDTPGHIYTQHKASSQMACENELRRAQSSKALPADQTNETVKLIRLRQKYQRVKKIKKQLVKDIKQKEGQLATSKVREESLLDLIELLKGKKTKICVCHVNKLQRQLRSTLTEHN